MSAPITVLKKRADFLAAAASGFKYVKPSLVVQSRVRRQDELSVSAVRVGFTATKTLGNAVVRSRVKRRLRAAVQQLEVELMPGCDYVFIGRQSCLKGTFDDLIHDMKHALKRLAHQMAEGSNRNSEQ